MQFGNMRVKIYGNTWYDFRLFSFNGKLCCRYTGNKMALNKRLIRKYYS